MKGTMVTIPVDEAEPALVEELSRPPDLISLFKAVGGLVEQVPCLTSYEDADLSPYEHVGTLVRCVTFRNTDAHSQGQPIAYRYVGENSFSGLRGQDRWASRRNMNSPE
jgi:hypothetical protein